MFNKKYFPEIEARKTLLSSRFSTRQECNPFIMLEKRFFALLDFGLTQRNSVFMDLVVILIEQFERPTGCGPVSIRVDPEESNGSENATLCASHHQQTEE